MTMVIITMIIYEFSLEQNRRKKTSNKIKINTHNKSFNEIFRNQLITFVCVEIIRKEKYPSVDRGEAKKYK